MEIKTKEARIFPRIKLSVPLRYQIRGSPDFSNTISENISLNGIGFSHTEFIAPQTLLELEIPILSRVLKPVAKVIWSNPFPHSNRYHVGAELQGLDLNEKKFLSDFITMGLNQFNAAE